MAITQQALAKAKPVGLEKPALRTAAYRELVGEGPLLNFGDEFQSPSGWKQQVQTANQAVLTAQTNGPGPRVLDDRGIPVDWDYRTSRVGPNNERLPSQAAGWLPDGSPDFGGGAGGALKKWVYNLQEKPRGEIERRDIGAYGPAATAMRENLASLKLDFETPGQSFPSLVRAMPTILGGSLQYIKDAWAFGEDNETVFGQAAKFVGASVNLLGDMANESAMWVERDVIGPRLLASEDLIAEKSPAYAEWLDNFRPLGGLSVLAPIAVARMLRLKGVFTEAEYEEARDRNRDAARMAYTAWYDPAAREEYTRLLQAGYDPRLLALDLENPGAELVGRVIFDPLSLFDVLAVGSRLRSVSRMRIARRELTVIAHTPFAGALNDIQNASGEAAIVANSRRVLETHGEMMNLTRNGITELAGRRGLLTLTAGGKRATVGQRVNNFMTTIIGAAGKDVDLSNSTWRGLVLAADTNSARRAEGLAILNQVVTDSRGAIPANVLFSESGNQSAILLRNLMLDDAGNFNPNVLTKMLEDAGNDPTKLAGLMDEKLNVALNKQFPTIQQQITTHDEYAKLLEQDEAAARVFLERNPLAAQEPNPLWRGLASIDEIAQKYFYRPAGELQSRLFMGTFPASHAYRIKNKWGNFLPTFVDMGPEAAIKSMFGVNPKGAINRTATILGGAIPEGALRGIGPGMSFRDAKKAGNGLDNFFTAGLRKAAKDEAANAAFVVERSVSRTMGSALKAERRIINQELAGLPTAQRQIVAAAMRQNWGNVDVTLDALRSKDGYDVARNLGFLTDDEVAKLQDLRLYDAALAAAREGDNAEDILNKLDVIKDEYRRVGRGVANEPVIYAMDDEWGQAIAADAHAISKNESIEAAALFQRRRHEARETERLFNEAVFSDRGLKRMAQEAILRRALAEAKASGLSDDDALQMALAQLDGI